MGLCERRATALIGAVTALIALTGLKCELPASIVVDTTADAVDLVPGDGACQTAEGSCSLRAAIQEANAIPGRQIVSIPEGVFLLTVDTGAFEDAAASGDLDLGDDIAILGVDAVATRIVGSGNERIFHVLPGVEASFEGVLIQNGRAPGSEDGGGILVGRDAQVTLGGSLVNANEAGGDGGGVYVSEGASLFLARSTVSYNTAEGDGGGLWNDGELYAQNATVSGNRAGYGGGIHQGPDATAELRNVTFDRNAASELGGNVHLPDGLLVAANTIFAHGSPNDCEGLPTSYGHNLVTDESCDLTGAGDLTGVDPGLGALRVYFGSRIRAHALMDGSPAATAGDPALCSLRDQLGTTRAADSCSIGSVQYQPAGVGLLHSRVVAANLNGNISLISGFSSTIVDTVAVTGTYDVAVHPDGHRVYLTRPGHDQVTVLDPDTKAGTGIAVGDQPFPIEINAAGTRLYVGNYLDESVTVIDTATNSVVDVVWDVGVHPWDLAMNSPHNDRLLIGLEQTQRIGVLQTGPAWTSHANPLTLPLTGSSPGLGFHASGYLGWVIESHGLQAPSELVRLDTVTPKAFGVGLVLPNQAGYAIAAHPSGSTVYVGGVDGDDVWAVDATTHTHVGTAVDGGGVPVGGLQMHPLGWSLYGSDAIAGRVSSINPNTLGVNATLPIAGSVGGLGILP